jgi:hypothetical protein
MTTSLLYVTALATVLATAYVKGYENFLKTMTQENGFFETITVLLLTAIFIYGVRAVYMYKARLQKWHLIAVVLFSLLAFLAAMEELSWGQHWFHFQSSEYFMQNNMQQETNLHNLIDGNVFSSIIYTSVYALLVFMPLLYKSFLKKHQRFSWLAYFDINAHTVLVVLFGASFQIYFYNDIGVIFDMLTLVCALALFAFLLFKEESSKMLKLHFAFVVFSVLFCMVHYGVFEFFNMQYEIREMFVVLASLMIFHELILKEAKL